MKRIFIALKIESGEILLQALSLMKSALKNEYINWTKPENIHITLAFLGDTEEKQIVAISNMLHEKCKGFGKFKLALKGTGVFRNYNDPRILWIGIELSDNLQELFYVIINGLKSVDIVNEDRPFNPHLTLGRIKKISDKQVLESVVEQYQYTHFQTVNVSEVILYESILLPPGPVYRPIAKCLLND